MSSRAFSPAELPRRWLVRLAVTALVVGLVAATGALALAYDPPGLEAGTIESTPEGQTIVAAQGYNIDGETDENKPARLASIEPGGEVAWAHRSERFEAAWFYDVDVLSDGDLLVVTTTQDERTLVHRYDPDADRVLWTESFAFHDTHDVDLINGDELLVGQMRNTRNGTSDDRVLVYDRTRDAVVWEWVVRKHYPNDTAGGVGDGDWTHLNDVDKVGDGEYLVSPRNFDQVFVVNRSTKEIEWRLGEDDDHATMYEQHNPQYLQAEDGTRTVLIADSENDRIVEYAYENGSWREVWVLGEDQFNWPRDADRLPNGNTLVADTLNHRVVEVTPTGEVVWEYYVPWAPYDVERMAHGDEPGGPTMRDLGAGGHHDLTGSAGRDPDHSLVEDLVGPFKGVPAVGPSLDWLTDRWRHVVPWIRPVWLPPAGMVLLSIAGVVLAGWGVGEVVYQRRRIRAGLGRAVERVRNRG